MRPLLALDFDGVISDSALECFWVASATAGALEGAGPGSAAPPAPEALRADPRYAPFLELMPLGNRAEDFAVALRIVERGAAVSSQTAYDAFREQHCDPDWLQRFHERFYALRAAAARRHPEAWHALMRPYPGIDAALRRLAERWELAIATSKDRDSVAALLSAYGLAGLFGAERLLDKEAGPDKAAHLRALSERSGTPLAAICFVDDKVSHLERVAGLGVRCALAAWGYNGERERRRARELGYPVLPLEGLAAELDPLGDALAGP